VRKQVTLNLALVAVISLTVAAVVASISRSAPGRTVSNLGVSSSGVEAGGMAVRQANLLGRKGGHDLYRLETDQGTCFGIGSAGSSTADRVACPFGNFTNGPLSLVVTVSSDAGGPFIASRVEGLAADGVAEIDVLGPGGSLMAKAGVTGNVFSLPVSVPLAGTEVLARDGAGRIVARASY
jgi:hypothetical protein